MKNQISKMVITLFTSIATFSVPATDLVTIKVNTHLVNPDIIAVVNQSVGNFLNYEGDLISGGLDAAEVWNPMIKQITKQGNITRQIVVESRAMFVSYDYDFGDPVDEEETTCKTTLNKVNGQYLLENAISVCDFDPSVEIYEGNPCCEGGPVVDSNFCFDSYEEGIAVCGSDDSYYWGDY